MSIKKHTWFDLYQPEVLNANSTSVVLGVKEHPWLALNKDDAIALAKHFKLTTHDIDCQAIKDMQGEIDLADEIHFDELAECKSTVMKHNKGIN